MNLFLFMNSFTLKVYAYKDHGIQNEVLPWWLSGKESFYNAGDMGLIPELGRCPGEGNDNPLQYPGLENTMDKEAWRALVHKGAKSQL